MCVLQCAMPANVAEFISEPPIAMTDIVALRCGDRTVIAADGRSFEMIAKHTRGVVIEIAGPYFMVLFRSGAAGEFIREELIRVASSLV